MVYLNRQSYEASIPKMAALFQGAFGRSIDASFLAWRYLDNPIRDLLVGVAMDEGDLIANYSASPCTLTDGENNFKSALSMTTMTDPRHAGKGHFRRLAHELYELMRSENYSLVWGFPNLNSHYGFVHKLGWRDVYEIPTMRRKLSGSKFVASAYRCDDSFLLEYEPLSMGSAIRVLKTKEYLIWRYAKHPINRYANIVINEGRKAAAFCVVKPYGSSLDIVDLQAATREHTATLLHQAIAYAEANGFDQINCWAPRHHFIHATAERLGFTNSEPVTYFGAKVFGEEPLSARVYDYSSWYLQMGDSDVY